jgi:hypothetical protein
MTTTKTPSKPQAVVPEAHAESLLNLTTPVAEAAQVLADLEARREKLAAQRLKDDEEMKVVSFRAHALHEAGANTALSEISERAIERDQRIRSLDCAITEARDRSAKRTPSAPQFRLGMIPAVQTSIMSLPQSWWRDWSRFVPPGERRSFSAFWARIHGPLEARIKQRLGESERTDTEAA